MNQFNDDQYDRVCDENEAMQKDINRLEAKVEQLEAQLREAKIVDYSKLAKLVAFHVLMAPLDRILEKDDTYTPGRVT